MSNMKRTQQNLLDCLDDAENSPDVVELCKEAAEEIRRLNTVIANLRGRKE